MALGEQAKMAMAPHFALEIHVPLSAAYELDAWVEHFHWLEPLFDERLEIRGVHMHVPSRHGPGFSVSEQARAGTVKTDTLYGPPATDPATQECSEGINQYINRLRQT
jgi:L-talarate/galactarate dehydratase